MKYDKKKIQGIYVLISIFIVVSLMYSSIVIAQPPLPPNAFQGKVFLNGKPVSEVEIKAYIDGELRGATRSDSKGRYGENFDYLLVDGDETDEGKTITFTVNNLDSTNVTVWHIMSPPRTFDIYVWSTGGGTGGGGTTTSGNIGGNTNNPPIAKMDLSSTVVNIGQEILFDASASYDPDNDTLTYTWSFGDGSTASGVKVRHSYSNIGTYIVSLTVRDGKGGEDTIYQTIEVVKGNYPPSKPVISGPTVGHRNISYNYTFKSTDPDNDSIKYTIDWGDGTNYTSGFIDNGTNLIITHKWNKSGKYTIHARVSDNKTISTVAIYIVYIDTMKVDGIGYLVDEDYDGIYDFLYNETSGNKTTVKYRDGEYLIDENGDDNWDYTFSNNGLTIYRNKEMGDRLPGFELIEMIIIVLLSFIFKKHFLRYE